MYRLIPSPTDSASRPSPRSLIAGLGAVAALSLIGFAGVTVAGYYLPGTAAKSYWFISRSSGVLAYVLITLGVLWGLMQSGRLFRSAVPPVVALGMHSFLNWLGLGLAALHGVILTGDGYIRIGLPQVLTPFISPYRPVPVGLGIIGFYLMLLLSLSFYARSYLGQRTFRVLHYSSFGVFVMVTLHGLLAGTDSGALWWLYSLSTAAVIALTALRIVSARRDRAQGSSRPAAARNGASNIPRPAAPPPRG